LYINIDRRRKVPASILIRALGFSENEKILELFYEKEVVSLEGIVPEDLEERVLFSDCIDAETG
jgi:DNA-directed RNA polymerase subunit beta